MRALVKTAPGKGNLEIQDVPIPKIGDDDILLKVTYCGICGSDLHRESGLDEIPTPLILGHEYTGVVAKVGKNVTQFEEGEAVAFHRGPSPWPGRERDGAFAEYFQVPADTMWKLPKGITLKEAAQFEIVTGPISWVRDIIRLQKGERIVISGPGPVGLLVTNFARLEGASHITVLGGPGDEKVRLPKALEMGV